MPVLSRPSIRPWGTSNMTDMPGPRTAPAVATMQSKYAQRGEGWREICNRVSSAVCDSGSHFTDFREAMLDMRLLPAGRNLVALGTTKKVTPYNCFVSGVIEDRLNGDGSIMGRLAEASRTMQMGGGVGYDFSLIRPRGDIVRSVESGASGPVSFIQLYDAMGTTISSYGERRGAQMGILRVDHPDIEEFILAKQNSNKINCFNLSIAITDEFMEAVEAGAPFRLRFEGRTYRLIDARTLWESIMRGTWDWAEPGVVFIDRINYWNNLKYCETIAATNPCSEQPLPPHGACLLGSINLTRYLRPLSRPSKLEGRYWFDWAQFAKDVPVFVRALDNVIDRALYPHQEQEFEAKNKRRMGIGVMGLANCIEAQGCSYGTDEFCARADKILTILKNEAYFASACLADEKGQFPLYDSQILDSPFIKGSVSASVRGKIAQSGLRNSHLISLAPTGTISFICDNISSGIEPVFSASEIRNVRFPDGVKPLEVTDYGQSILGIIPKTAREVTPEEHIKVLCVAQRHCDSAVSKTCNVPSSTSWEDFKKVYQKAYLGGAKGCATFQDGGQREGIRQTAEIADCQGGSCERVG